MTSDETIQILELISGWLPSTAMNDQMPATWHAGLADISAADATRVVNEHFITVGGYIDVAEIRRRVADRYGVLPPSSDAAFAQVAAWNRWRGHASQPWPTTDPPYVHPVARQVADDVGWTRLAEGLDGVTRKDWREAYAKAARKAEIRALLPGGIAEVRAELEAARARPELPPAEPEAPQVPIDPERVAALKDFIAKSRVGRPGVLGKPDRAEPPTPDQISDAQRQFERWMKDNGYEIPGSEGVA